MVIIDYKLIVSNIDYYRCKKGITKSWISDVTGIDINYLNNILGYKIEIDDYYIFFLEEISEALDLDMEELNDIEFREITNKQIELEDFRFCQLNNIVKLEEIKDRSQDMIELLESKDKDYKKLIKVNLDRIRELCDDIEIEI